VKRAAELLVVKPDWTGSLVRLCTRGPACESCLKHLQQVLQVLDDLPCFDLVYPKESETAASGAGVPVSHGYDEIDGLPF